MYYEEAVIDGQMHFRTTPSGEWHLLSNEALTEKIVDLRKTIVALEAEFAA